MMMTINIVAIDCEYNSSHQILSFGYKTKKCLDEFYFNHCVDKRSFKIHCLSKTFLNDYGFDFFKSKSLIKDVIKNKDYIVGFDLFNDFKVLNIKSIHLYNEKKIIDLKIVLDVLNLNSISLSKMFLFLNKKHLISDATYHTSSYDSEITFNIINLLIKLAENNGVSEEFFLKRLAEITFLNKNLETDIDIKDLYWIKSLFKEEINHKINQKIDYYMISNGICLFCNEDNIPIFKIPIEYIDNKKILNLNKVETTRKFSKIGVKFDNKYIKDDIKLFSFCN